MAAQQGVDWGAVLATMVQQHISALAFVVEAHGLPQAELKTRGFGRKQSAAFCCSLAGSAAALKARYNMDLLLEAQRAVRATFTPEELQALRQAAARSGTLTFWRGRDSARLRGHLGARALAATAAPHLANAWMAAALPQVPRVAVERGKPLELTAREGAPRQLSVFVVDGTKVSLWPLPCEWLESLRN